MDFLQKLDYRTNDEFKKIVKEISEKTFSDINTKVTFLDNSDDTVVQMLLEKSDDEKKGEERLDKKTIWAMAMVEATVREEMAFSINQLQIQYFIPEAQEIIKEQFSELSVKEAKELKFDYPVEQVPEFFISKHGYDGFDGTLFNQSLPYVGTYCSENGTVVSDICNLRLFYRILCHKLYGYYKEKITFGNPVKIAKLESFFKLNTFDTKRLGEFNQSIETQERMLVNYVQRRLKWDNISLLESEGVIKFNFHIGINEKIISLALPIINDEVHLHFIHPDALFSLALYDVFLNGTYVLQEFVYFANLYNIKMVLHFNNKKIAQLAENYTRLDHMICLKDDIIVFCAEE